MKNKYHLFATIAIYFSLFTQMQAISLLGIAIPLNLAAKGVESSNIGLVMACYSVGIIIGCLQGKKFIHFVGHIRAFSGFASLAAITGVLHFLIDHIITSAIFRLVTGLSAAVLLVVLESWCLAIAKQRKSTRILAGYQLIFYSAMALGLYLVNIYPSSLSNAFLIASILFSVALIPMSLIRLKAPKLKLEQVSISAIRRKAPIGIIGALMAGIAIGSVYNLSPVFAKGLGVNTNDISLFMISIVLSGVLFQYGINSLSRIFLRKTILVLVLLILSGNALLVIHLKDSVPLPTLGIMIGSLISCIYPVSLSITFERCADSSSVAISSSMLLFYGVGGIIGPVFSGAAMAFFNDNALFYFLTSCLIITIILILVINQRTLYDDKTTKECN